MRRGLISESYEYHASPYHNANPENPLNNVAQIDPKMRVQTIPDA